MRYRLRADGPGDYMNSPSAPTLVTEENPEIGRLLGPDGKVAKIVRAKATIPFGPQPTKEQ